MFFYTEKLINEIVPDQPDPDAAKALQETLGGHFGEMRTMMQFFFQSANFRGKAKPFRDLIRGVFVEEISHVELVMTTINKLLEGSGTSPADGNAGNAAIPLNEALRGGQIHHYLVGAQGSMPVDAAGNPWNGSWVYSSGNLIADLLDNLVLESTGRLQKCRIYEMSSNKTLRETLAFLIVRDTAHQIAFAKALETLGVNWGKVLPIPDIDISKYPECQKYIDRGWDKVQFNFRMDTTQIAQIFQGMAPSRTGGTLSVVTPPEGYPLPEAAEIPAEFSPGLPQEIQSQFTQTMPTH
ncbi:manganese catalase family protein [Lihuaxuella thermophila]|uniref:Mn-containing catalase n=1 Tax=Lihuaxuella thermophila TaxID=1173111 RepID=A0A1H8BU93_9BACL|nr:manganese catalase family protein [Lihuaxuella thermophila]SEM85578.1 Mn-containing catalase [Lihuaxuella thermophila]